MTRTRISIIGCGRFANKAHFPSLAKFDDVEVVAACDIDEAKLAATADKYRIAGRYTDFRRMLDETKPDGVYVIMPETVRFPVIKEVLARGHHAFMEKPPARTTAEIRELAALAESKRLITMVGTNRRFIPVLVEARRRMQERGTPELVVATYYKNEIPETVVERRFWDVLVADGIHAVDTMRWLASVSSVGAQHAAPEVVCVRARSQRLDAVCDIVFQAVVEFSNGCIGVLLLSWAAGNRYHAFEIHAGGATAYILPDEGARIVADGKKDPVWTMPSEGSLYGPGDSPLLYGFLQENRHFIDCLRSGTPTLSPFSEAVKSMELTDLIKNACSK